MSLNVDHLLEEFNNEGDFVGLWQIVSRIREESPNLSRDEIMGKTIKIVESMLLNGFEVGDSPYSDKGYSRWGNQNILYVTSRIKNEWMMLDKDPDLADIAWFLPPALNN